MFLQDEVCSLELAKELKALGVKRESFFYWLGDILVFKTQTGFFTEQGSGMNLHPLLERAIPAFTVAELGEMLPEDFESSKIRMEEDVDDQSHIKYICRGPLIPSEKSGLKSFRLLQCGFTETDARAKMLIYLIKNKLITV